jgi:hypothetical protein
LPSYGNLTNKDYEYAIEETLKEVSSGKNYAVNNNCIAVNGVNALYKRCYKVEGNAIKSLDLSKDVHGDNPYSILHDDYGFNDLISKMEKYFGDNLLPKLGRYDECNGEKILAEEFLKNIKVRPRIIDNSGFYSGEKIVEWKRKAYNENCPLDHKNLDYKIYSQLISTKYKIEISNEIYRPKFSDREIILSPAITIEKAIFKNVIPNKMKLEDKFLLLKYEDGKISLANKSRKFMKITSISFYYNNEISNLSNLNIEIPPDGFLANKIHLNEFNIDDRKIDFTISKKESLSSIVGYFFAVKYNIGDKYGTRTLYDGKRYKLSDLIQ